MSTNGNANHHEQYAATGPTTTESAPQIENSQSDLPKDEIGWYFVEQYYTTLSKNPDKLHLFYGKKSQFVAGAEAEVTTVCVNRPNIQERIKQLDFEDSKVRISNVDSQGSADNILIQVIGEISSKGAESRKFVQSFVLAKQPSGYFVLNDILRYIVDEPVDEISEPAAEAPVEGPASTEAAPAVEAEPATEAEVPAEEPVAEEKEPAELDTAAVTQKLEEAAEEAPVPAATEAPVPEPAVEAQEPVVEKTEEAQPEPEKVVEEVAKEEAAKPEEPKDPAPTPAVPAVAVPAVAAPVAAPTPAEHPKPKEPPKPMTWASRLAASAAPAAPKPVVPKVATPPAAAQARAPAPAQTTAGAPQPIEAAAAAPKDQGSEWQTAETKRQNRAQPAAAASQTEKEGTLAYIKFVTDKVKEADLKSALEAFGEVVYFDINRTKNCAFVEFRTPAGYNAAAAANPHTVNGENIVVEPRRPKSNAYGGNNYNPARGPTTGGRSSRGGYESQRSGSQGGGRGGFAGQGRGGRGGAPRGRGASQATA